MKIDFNAISFIDWMDFASFMKDGHTKQAVRAINPYILDWEYDVPVEKGLESLPNVLQVIKSLKQILMLANDKVKEFGFEDVIVDLTKWNFNEYDKWESDRVKGNWSSVERVIHEVAKLGDTNKNKPLNAMEGIRMVGAVVQVYQNSFLETY